MIASVQQEVALPVALDAERSVVGSLLINPQCATAVSRLVSGHDFVDDDLRAAFKVIIDRHRAGEPIDPVLVLRDLQGKVRNPDLAAAVLGEAGNSVPTSAHAEHYAEILAETGRKRRLFEIADTARCAAANGHTSREVINDLLADLDAVRQAENAHSASIERFGVTDLVDQYPTLNPPVIDGLFREGETVNVVSTSKVGKSWLVYYVATCVSLGISVFDRYRTAMGRVLLVDNELHKQTLASRIPTVTEAMGYPVDRLAGQLDVWSLRGRLKSLAELQGEFEQIQPGDYKLIILDAKYRFIADGASENDNASETAFYNLLDRIAERTRAAILLVHHASKGSQNDKRVTDVGAGAGAQSRAADCHLVLREHEDDNAVVLEAAVRSFAPVEPLVLRWNFPLWTADHEADPAALKGARGKADERRFENDSRDKLRVIQAMSEAGHRVTNKQLRKLVGMGRERLCRLLDSLESDGQIESQTTTKNGNRCDEFWIAESN